MANHQPHGNICNSRPFNLRANHLKPETFVYGHCVNRGFHNHVYLITRSQQFRLGSTPERTGYPASLAGISHEEVKDLLTVTDAENSDEFPLNQCYPVTIPGTSDIASNGFG